MSDLIEALQIFLKYGNHQYPTYCMHDVLAIMEIEPSAVTEEDKRRLKELGFSVNKVEDYFFSFRFGSA